MALIKCIECGEDISSLSERCPKCGCPTEITNEFYTYKFDEDTKTFDRLIFVDDEVHDTIYNESHRVTIFIRLSEDRKDLNLVVRDDEFSGPDENAVETIEYLFSIRKTLSILRKLDCLDQIEFEELFNSWANDNGTMNNTDDLVLDSGAEVVELPLGFTTKIKPIKVPFNIISRANTFVCKFGVSSEREMVMVVNTYTYPPFPSDIGVDTSLVVCIPLEHCLVMRKHLRDALKLVKK